MAFFILTFMFMFICRKVGWGLSKSVLYTSSMIISIFCCVAWGIFVALTIHKLIMWQEPGLILRIIMGYALGAYVSIPNYGLLVEGSIPDHALSQHTMISNIPLVVYIMALFAFRLLLPGT